MRIFKDSKEFPYYNFERINSTGNFFYMIKGYEDGDDVSSDEDKLKEQYQDVIQDYVVSINAKNDELVKQGKKITFKMDMAKFEIARRILEFQIKAKSITVKSGLEYDDGLVSELLKQLKIQRTGSLVDQLTVIEQRIINLENNLAKLDAENEEKEESEFDANKNFVNVESILERSLDMKTLSLYRFGLLQEQALRKIEQLNKQHNGR